MAAPAASYSAHTWSCGQASTPLAEHAENAEAEHVVPPPSCHADGEHGGSPPRPQVTLHIKSMLGHVAALRVHPSTPLPELKALAAAQLGMRADEALWVRGGKLLSGSLVCACDIAVAAEGSGATGEASAGSPSVVHHTHSVVHAMRRMTRRGMAVVVRVRAQRLALTVPQCSTVRQLKDAVLKALRKPTHASASSHSFDFTRYNDVRLVLNGRLLDEATGLPIVEYGVDDGVTVLGIPTQDVNRCVNVHVKLPGLPNQALALLPKWRVADVRSAIASRLPPAVSKRHGHFATHRVFLATDKGRGAELMLDNKALSLYSPTEGAQLFIVAPPRCAVELPASGSGGRVVKVALKEDIFGVRVYDQAIAALRREVAREQETKKPFSSRARRARTKQAKQEAKEAGRGMSRGFFDTGGGKKKTKKKKKTVHKKKEAGLVSSDGMARGFLAPGRKKRTRAVRTPPTRAVTTTAAADPPPICLGERPPKSPRKTGGASRPRSLVEAAATTKAPAHAAAAATAAAGVPRRDRKECHVEAPEHGVLAAMATFLNAPLIRAKPRALKLRFLRSKGLSTAECEAALCAYETAKSTAECKSAPVRASSSSTRGRCPDGTPGRGPAAGPQEQHASPPCSPPSSSAGKTSALVSTTPTAASATPSRKRAVSQSRSQTPQAESSGSEAEGRADKSRADSGKGVPARRRRKKKGARYKAMLAGIMNGGRQTQQMSAAGHRATLAKSMPLVRAPKLEKM